jgi:predicted Rossmann-fold nucleotide-binding protein
MASRFAEEVKAERAEASECLAKIGVIAVDPAAAERQLWGEHNKAKIQTNMKLKIMDAMVKRDQWLIRRSDLLLVLTGDTPSDGTWHELVYALQLPIPVVMIAPRRCQKKNPLVGWSNILIKDIVPDLKAACRLIKRKYVKEEETQKAYFNAAIKNAKKSIKNGKKKKH